MYNPEANPQNHIPLREYFRSPAELVVCTAMAYAGIMAGEQAVPALNNLVEILTKTIGGAP